MATEDWRNQNDLDLWVAGLQPPSCVQTQLHVHAGHTVSKGTVPWAGRLHPKSSCSCSPSKSSHSTGRCAHGAGPQEARCRAAVTASLPSLRRQRLPKGGGCVDPCDNAEFPIRDGDGHGSVGCHIESAVVKQHSPAVRSPAEPVAHRKGTQTPDTKCW